MMKLTGIAILALMLTGCDLGRPEIKSGGGQQNITINEITIGDSPSAAVKVGDDTTTTTTTNTGR